MLKKITASVLSAIMPIMGIAQYSGTGFETTTSEVYIPSETAQNAIIETAAIKTPEIIIEYVEIPVPIELEKNLLQYVETDDFFELTELFEECEFRKVNASQIIESAKNCGYKEDHPIVSLAQEEFSNADSLSIIYKEKLDKLNIKKCWEEYPVATEVWLYLKDLGYSDYICAAIIGNMMAEVGGGTLNLHWSLGTDFYGLCQWYIGYYPQAQGLDVKGQLKLLKDTIEYEFNLAGFIYKKGFNYEQFIEIDNERDAALAFAMCYERCAKKYYYIRCDYAEIAYNYFVN